MPWSHDNNEHLELSSQISKMAEIRDDKERFKRALGLIASNLATAKLIDPGQYATTVAMHALYASDQWPENQPQTKTT